MNDYDQIDIWVIIAGICFLVMLILAAIWMIAQYRGCMEIINDSFYCLQHVL